MPSELDLMRAGQLYNSTAAELVKMRATAKQKVYRYNQTAPEANALRAQILQELIDCPSRDAYIEVPFRMDYGSNVHIGANFYANYDSIFLDIAPITIGDNVMLGPRVSLYTAGHPLVVSVRNEFLEYGHPITIGNNVWIGGNAVICPGVTIGDNTVIGAGAIVTKDMPANSLIVGNPAHVLRSLTAADEQYWQAEKQRYLAARNQ